MNLSTADSRNFLTGDKWWGLQSQRVRIFYTRAFLLPLGRSHPSCSIIWLQTRSDWPLEARTKRKNPCAQKKRENATLTHEKEKDNMEIRPYKDIMEEEATVLRIPLSCRLGRFASCSPLQKCVCAVTMRQIRKLPWSMPKFFAGLLDQWFIDRKFSHGVRCGRASHLSWAVELSFCIDCIMQYILHNINTPRSTQLGRLMQLVHGFG